MTSLALAMTCRNLFPFIDPSISIRLKVSAYSVWPPNRGVELTPTANGMSSITQLIISLYAIPTHVVHFVLR